MKYKTFKEFLEDYNYVNEHQDDYVFLAHVANKARMSDEDIKEKVEIFLEGLLLESNFWVVVGRILKSNPNLTVKTKTSTDPWFEV
jgi:hypothetical protein